MRIPDILKPARPALAIAAVAALGIAPLAVAQESSPEGTPSADAATLPPVDLHAGSCADPVLEPWADLGNVQRRDYAEVAEQLRDDLSGGDADDATPAAEVDIDASGTIDDVEIFGEEMAADPPEAVWYAEGGVDADFAALFESEEEGIIAVHRSPEEYETILACGDIAGLQHEDMRRVVVPLEGVGAGQYRGFAVFGNDFGDATSGVRVYLFEGAGAMASPEADVTGTMATPDAATTGTMATPAVGSDATATNGMDAGSEATPTGG